MSTMTSLYRLKIITREGWYHRFVPFHCELRIGESILLDSIIFKVDNIVRCPGSLGNDFDTATVSSVQVEDDGFALTDKWEKGYV